MSVSAKIIADSISPLGDRLTTIECRFHRFILPEVNTHRMLSKSAQSSRAIPSAKRIAEVREDPALPVFWGKTQRGMVADEELTDDEIAEAISVWHESANAAADYAQYLTNMKVHKQIASRILEPFLWQTNVMSGTDAGWLNLLRLRDHPDAQPEFRALAEQIRIAYEESTPKEINYGQWHTPYVLDEELESYTIELIRKISVARVARTSYGTAVFEVEKDLELEDRLWSAEPRHDAPYEMVATPTAFPNAPGNFRGWQQLRHYNRLFDS